MNNYRRTAANENFRRWYEEQNYDTPYDDLDPNELRSRQVDYANTPRAERNRLASVPTRAIVNELNNRKRIANYRRRANSNRRVNRKLANYGYEEAVDFVFSSFDKDLEEFKWMYDNKYDELYEAVRTILERGFVGGPFNIDNIIDDIVNGRSRFSNRRAN